MTDVDVSLTDEKIFKDMFSDMSTRVDKWISDRGGKPDDVYSGKDNKSMPPIVYLYPGSQGEYVTWAKWLDVRARYWKWVADHEGTPPEFIWINKIILVEETGSLGKFNTAFDFKPTNALKLYNWYRDDPRVIYAYYYNDIYSNSEVISRINNTQGVNCTDMAQFSRALLKEMGYEVRFCNSYVKCSDGVWYGHVWLQIRGKEYSEWTYFDATAVTQQGISRPLGQLCCTGGTDSVSYDDAWLFGRDTNL